MPFDTAVFYDIENLIKGYGTAPGVIENPSLAYILTALKTAPGVGQIALQRAYANWSDPRLSALRGEINALGIDPVQVFGFSRDQKKNAADIQLAVDAIDLAHIRSTLTTFVIVSGDGAFTALAKKLHEYGKTVIGCGYRSSASKVFRAVCDAFIELPDPIEEAEESRPRPLSPLPAESPLLASLKRHLQPVRCTSTEEILDQGRKVLDWLATVSDLRAELRRTGIVPSLVRELFDYAVAGFQPARLGYKRFKEALQCICSGTELQLIFAPPNDLRLAWRHLRLPGFEPLPDLEPYPTHSEEVYRSLLAASQSSLRLPAGEALRKVCFHLASLRPSGMSFASILESLLESAGAELDIDGAKAGLFVMLACGLLRKEPEGRPLAECTLYLNPPQATGPQLLGLIREACPLAPGSRRHGSAPRDSFQACSRVLSAYPNGALPAISIGKIPVT